MSLGAGALRIIATGGTFDKQYDPIAGELTFTESHVAAIVAQSRLTVPTAVEVLALIDSRDMRDQHRERILAACRCSSEAAIVVIHGTDTMCESARLLGPSFGGEVDQSRKTVVFTGAMIPCTITNSDALINFGFACACAQILPYGVYLAMNGCVFAWNKVRKNKEAGIFEEGEPVFPI